MWYGRNQIIGMRRLSNRTHKIWPDSHRLSGHIFNVIDQLQIVCCQFQIGGKLATFRSRNVDLKDGSFSHDIIGNFGWETVNRSQELLILKIIAGLIIDLSSFLWNCSFPYYHNPNNNQECRKFLFHIREAEKMINHIFSCILLWSVIKWRGERWWSAGYSVPGMIRRDWVWQERWWSHSGNRRNGSMDKGSCLMTEDMRK